MCLRERFPFANFFFSLIFIFSRNVMLGSLMREEGMEAVH